MSSQPGIVGDLRPDLTAFRAILALSHLCTPALEPGQTAALTVAGGVFDACSDTYVLVAGWWNQPGRPPADVLVRPECLPGYSHLGVVTAPPQ